MRLMMPRPIAIAVAQMPNMTSCKDLSLQESAILHRGKLPPPIPVPPIGIKSTLLRWTETVALFPLAIHYLLPWLFSVNASESSTMVVVINQCSEASCPQITAIKISCLPAVW